MFCSNCGKEIEDNSCVCPYCGVSADENHKQIVPVDGGKTKRAKKLKIISAVVSVLCFLGAVAIVILINVL